MDVESDEDYVDATGMSGISTSFDKKINFLKYNSYCIYLEF